MIYYLEGKITVREKDFIVVDVEGVGYKVFVSSGTDYDPSKENKVFCFTQKTDNDIKLYGFKEKANLELFENLIKISGIGPKTALRIASSLSLKELKEGIESEDKNVMKKVFSIGNKKGQQVVFELSRKFVKEAKEDEAFKALKNLGFCNEEIKLALEKVSGEKGEAERVEEALKIIGKKKE